MKLTTEQEINNDKLSSEELLHQLRSSNHKGSVLVAMSGGVDSSVAALLLKEAGYEVVGVTMRLWVDPLAEETAGDEMKGCCSLDAVSDAAKVAAKLDIPHYVLNMKDQFYRDIVCNFKDEYLLGRTPNPCIECNRAIKFSALLDKAAGLGIDYLSTGHYARIKQDEKSDRYRLLRGIDYSKDQSYMLYILTQNELNRILFPLGELEKRRVREIAEANDLIVADKAESQEICFIPDNDYRAFLSRQCPEAIKPGDIVSTSGEKLGRHRGVAYYTVGQRKGLGITSPHPLYVVNLNPAKNLVVAGPVEETYSTGLIAGSLNYISGAIPEEPLELEVKIRYRAPAVPARLYPPEKGFARIIFEEKQKAVTPGQSAVFYRGDEVLGGGIIETDLT